MFKAEKGLIVNLADKRKPKQANSPPAANRHSHSTHSLNLLQHRNAILPTLSAPPIHFDQQSSRTPSPYSSSLRPTPSLADFSPSPTGHMHSQQASLSQHSSQPLHSIFSDLNLADRMSGPSPSPMSLSSNSWDQFSSYSFFTSLADAQNHSVN